MLHALLGSRELFLAIVFRFPFFILFPTLFLFHPSFPPFSSSYMPVSQALKYHPSLPSVGVASLEYKRFSVLFWTSQYNSFIGIHIHSLISAFDICKVCNVLKLYFFYVCGCFACRYARESDTCQMPTEDRRERWTLQDRGYRCL